VRRSGGSVHDKAGNSGGALTKKEPAKRVKNGLANGTENVAKKTRVETKFRFKRETRRGGVQGTKKTQDKIPQNSEKKLK